MKNALLIFSMYFLVACTQTFEGDFNTLADVQVESSESSSDDTTTGNGTSEDEPGGGDSDSSTDINKEENTDLNYSFEVEIQSIITDRCVACHTSGGLAKTSGLLFSTNTDVASITANKAALASLDGQYIINKSTNALIHVGQNRFENAAVELAIWSDYLLNDKSGSDSSTTSTNAQVTFESLCAGCHEKNDDSIILSLESGISTSIISATMPKNNPTACDNSCAEMLTNYLATENQIDLSTGSESGSVDDAKDPVLLADAYVVKPYATLLIEQEEFLEQLVEYPDNDNDGISNDLDAYPNDASRIAAAGMAYTTLTGLHDLSETLTLDGVEVTLSQVTNIGSIPISGVSTAVTSFMFTAPKTGNYHFYVKGDDSGDLFLVDSTMGRIDRRLATTELSSTWDKYPTQRSELFSLSKGQQLGFVGVGRNVYGNGRLFLGFDLNDSAVKEFSSADTQAVNYFDVLEHTVYLVDGDQDGLFDQFDQDDDGDGTLDVYDDYPLDADRKDGRYLDWAFTKGDKIIRDVSGNGHHATLPAQSLIGDYQNLNDVLWLYNKDARVEATGLDLSLEDDFSFSFWIQPKGRVDKKAHVIDAGGSFRAYIWTPNGTERYLRMGPNNGDVFGMKDQHRIANNTWTHVMLTHRSGFGELYINGEFSESRQIHSAGKTMATLTMSSMETLLNDVRWYETALTDEQVRVRFNNEWILANSIDLTAEVLDNDPLPDSTLPADLQMGESIYVEQCVGCHGPEGQGGASISLLSCSTCEDFDTLVEKIVQTMPVGNTGDCGFSCATELSKYITNVITFDTDSAADVESVSGLKTSQWLKAAHKVSLNLADRLPTGVEVSSVRSKGELGFDNLIDDLMNDPAFGKRIGEVFNEVFKTDIGLTDREFGYDRFYRFAPNFSAFGTEYGQTPKMWYMRALAEEALAKEPIKLVEYIINNKRPITEILTSDETYVNYYSAYVYGLDTDALGFKKVKPYARNRNGLGSNPSNMEEHHAYDFNDYKLVNLRDLSDAPSFVERAGVLTTASWLVRFPSSETNLNRHRANTFLTLFLDTNVLDLEGSRMNLAEATAGTEPTLSNPTCASCHNILDPVASSFQWWTHNANPQRLNTNNWHEKPMLGAGFGTKSTPASYSQRPLEWLALEAVKDKRFAKAMAKHLYFGLTNITVLKDPRTIDDATGTFLPLDDQDLLDYQAQQNFIRQLTDLLIASNFEIRPVVKAIVKSSYFIGDLSPAVALTPERLTAKLKQTTGQVWSLKDGDDYHHQLSLTTNLYYSLMNGLDHATVETPRSNDINATMAATMKTLALEVSCEAVAYNFSIESKAQRNMFKNISHTQTIADQQENIRITVSDLFWTFFGIANANAVEVERYVEFLTEVEAMGQLAIASGEANINLNKNCQATRDPINGNALPNPITADRNYTIRSWMALIEVMLNDSRYLHH